METWSIKPFSSDFVDVSFHVVYISNAIYEKSRMWKFNLRVGVKTFMRNKISRSKLPHVAYLGKEKGNKSSRKKEEYNNP